MHSAVPWFRLKPPSPRCLLCSMMLACPCVQATCLLDPYPFSPFGFYPWKQPNSDSRARSPSLFTLGTVSPCTASNCNHSRKVWMALLSYPLCPTSDSIFLAPYSSQRLHCNNWAFQQSIKWPSFRRFSFRSWSFRASSMLCGEDPITWRKHFLTIPSNWKLLMARVFPRGHREVGASNTECEESTYMPTRGLKGFNPKCSPIIWAQNLCSYE